MTGFWTRPFFRSRYLLAVFSGVLLALSFPKAGIAGFAWVAPGLMIAAALEKTGGERFRLGYLAGLTHYLIALYWLLLIPYRWHGIPFGPAAGWLALSAFLALFMGGWVWVAGSGPIGLPRASDVAHSPVRERSSAGTWIARTAWALSAAACWVGFEMVIARIFHGFPWDLLGVSQHEILPLIQFVSFTGVYGVSFLLVWMSLAFLCAGLMLLHKPSARSPWLAEIALPLAVVAALFVFGLHQLRQPPPARETIRVTFIQPSIPQTLIWDETRDDERFADVLALTRKALTNRCDLVLWPEAAVPRLLRWYPEVARAVTDIASEYHAWMIIGADDMEPKPGSRTFKDAKFYNSSFLISPEGQIVMSYRKRSLVMFGEYVPLVTWFPFIKYLTPIDGGFTPGDRPVPFELSNPEVETSVLICFEDVFPHLAREYVNSRTSFLVNLTNNGWFGESAAQWQHAMTALFRAVENGVPLLRCSNNGLTCWVDERGRVREIFHDSRGTIYGEGFMYANIPILAAGQTHPLTFYTRHGDVFGWTCFGWLAVLFLGRTVLGIRQRRPARSI